MMQERKYYCTWLIIAIISYQNLYAQKTGKDSLLIPLRNDSAATTTVNTPPGSSVTIGSIIISGNKKTKAVIILREIPFKPGEEYPLAVLVKKFEDARRLLMNTSLFNGVVVAAKNFEGSQSAGQAGKIDIIVNVKERWYLFPAPYFKPVDRNLNQWLVEQNASLSRVNFGAKLLYYNATGRNDKFKFLLGAGYTKQFSISYNRPYIDKNMKWGMSASFAVGKNHEVNYNTIDDKQVFLKDKENYLRNFLNARFELIYRRAIKTSHSFGIGYISEEVGDTIVKLNPSYFNSGHNNVSFPEVFYSVSYFDLDYNPYPTKGYAAQLYVGKRGLTKNTNLWQLSVKGLASWHLSPKTFFSLNVYGGIKVPFHQPYYSQRFLGYGDVFMQGYEYYVVDGAAGGYLKTTLTREMLNFKIRIPPVKKGKVAQHIPVRIFGKIFGNTGYVYNPQPGDNLLSNKMLYSGGIGIDILTFYDVTFKLEWTFNQLGQNGLFLHRKTIF
jgi:outer membrane protein assembly factor BamA